jgi:hypothetical protein
MTTNTLASGTMLTARQSLVSANGLYMLMVGANGILFLENLQTGVRLWSVGQIGKVNPVLTMQTNGNLVFTEGNPPQVVWSSNTPQYPNASAVLENNGNLVINDASGDPVWALGTAQGAVVVAQVFQEVRADLELALSKLSVIERAFPEINLARAASDLERSEAGVNVRSFGASAE